MSSELNANSFLLSFLVGRLHIKWPQNLPLKNVSKWYKFYKVVIPCRIFVLGPSSLFICMEVKRWNTQMTVKTRNFCCQCPHLKLHSQIAIAISPVYFYDVTYPSKVAPQIQKCSSVHTSTDLKSHSQNNLSAVFLAAAHVKTLGWSHVMKPKTCRTIQATQRFE